MKADGNLSQDCLSPDVENQSGQHSKTPYEKRDRGARPVKLEQSEEMTVTGLGDASETRANLKIWLETGGFSIHSETLRSSEQGRLLTLELWVFVAHLLC